MRGNSAPGLTTPTTAVGTNPAARGQSNSVGSVMMAVPATDVVTTLWSIVREVVDSPPRTSGAVLTMITRLHGAILPSIAASVSEQTLPASTGRRAQSGASVGEAISMTAVAAVTAALELVIAFGVACPAALGICLSPAKRAELQALDLPRTALVEARASLRPPGACSTGIRSDTARRDVLMASWNCVYEALRAHQMHPAVVARLAPDAVRCAVQLCHDPLLHRSEEAEASVNVEDVCNKLRMLLRAALNGVERARAVFEAAAGSNGGKAPPTWYSRALRGLLSWVVCTGAEALAWWGAAGSLLIQPQPQSSELASSASPAAASRAGSGDSHRKVAFWHDEEGQRRALSGGAAALLVALLEDVAERHLEGARHRVAAAVVADPMAGGAGDGKVECMWAEAASVVSLRKGHAAGVCMQLLALVLAVDGGAATAGEVTPAQAVLLRQAAAEGLALMLARADAHEGGWAAAVWDGAVAQWLLPLRSLSAAPPDGALASGVCAAGLEACLASLQVVSSRAVLAPSAVALLSRCCLRGLLRVRGAATASGRPALAARCDALLHRLVAAPGGGPSAPEQHAPLVRALCDPWPLASAPALVLAAAPSGGLCLRQAAPGADQDVGVGADDPRSKTRDAAAPGAAAQRSAGAGPVTDSAELEQTASSSSAEQAARAAASWLAGPERPLADVVLALLSHQRRCRAELSRTLRQRGSSLEALATGTAIPAPTPSAAGGGGRKRSAFALRADAASAVAACVVVLEQSGPALAANQLGSLQCAAELLEQADGALAAVTAVSPVAAEDDAAAVGEMMGSVPVALALLAAGLDQPLPADPEPRSAALAAARRCSAGLAAIAAGPVLRGLALFPDALLATATALRMGLVSFCAWNPVAAGGAVSGAGGCGDDPSSTSALLAGAAAADAATGAVAAGAAATSAELASRLLQAVEFIRSDQVALQGGGFQELAGIARARHLQGALAADTSRLRTLAEICVEMLAHPQSFVHLAAADALCALIDAGPDQLMLPAIRLHAAPGTPEASPSLSVRVRLAEALSRAVRRCGATLPRFAAAILAASLRTATRGSCGASVSGAAAPSLASSLDEAELRSACLGCVSAVLITLGDAGETFAGDAVATTIALLHAEERRAASLAVPVAASDEEINVAARVEARASASVRRAAVLLLVDVATRCGDQAVIKPWACLGDVAAALNEVSASSTDATVRGHAGVGITRLRDRTSALAAGVASRKSLQIGLRPMVV